MPLIKDFVYTFYFPIYQYRGDGIYETLYIPILKGHRFESWT